MRILICEDSEHNLQSAREFAEKVKGEHEVVIHDSAAKAAYALMSFEEDKIDYVLTDLYLPTRKGTVLPGGLAVALAALQRGLPTCIITDGHAHCDDEMVASLWTITERNNERLHLYLLQDEGSKGFKGWSEGGWKNGKLVKDWEFCFRAITEPKG